MKIKFKSEHLTNKAGDEIEVTVEQGKYFIAMGIAEEVNKKNAPREFEMTEMKITSKQKRHS